MRFQALIEESRVHHANGSPSNMMEVIVDVTFDAVDSCGPFRGRKQFTIPAMENPGDLRGRIMTIEIPD